MYRIKDINDLNRCINLNDGVPLECYANYVDNRLLLEKCSDGLYVVSYSINNVIKKYDTEGLLKSKIGDYLETSQLSTHDFTINGTML